MSSEPNKSVEDALRAYADKRRKDAEPPLEMHPVTRRMLHGEVARLRLRKAKKTGFRFFSGPLFWPRVSLACSALLLAAVLAWVWVASLETDYELDQLAQLSQSDYSVEKSAAPEPVGNNARKKKGLPGAIAKGLTTGSPASGAKLDSQKVVVSERRGRSEAIQPKTEQAESKSVSKAAQPRPSRSPRYEYADVDASSAKDAPVNQPESEVILEAVQTQGTTKNLAMYKKPTVRESQKEDRIVSEQPSTFADVQSSPKAGSRRAMEPVTRGSIGQATPTKTAPAQPYSVSDEYLVRADREPDLAIQTRSEAKEVVTTAPANPEENVTLSRMLALKPAEEAAPALGTTNANRLAVQSNDTASQPRRFQYRRVPVSDKTKSSLRQKVSSNFLAEFELEEQNGRIRLVDKNGSVYEGAVLSSTERFFRAGSLPANNQNETEEAAARARARQQESTPANFGWAVFAMGDQDSKAFRVSGTNRDANQYVIIQGTLSAMPEIDGAGEDSLVAAKHSQPPSSSPKITSAPMILKSAAEPAKAKASASKQSSVSSDPTKVWARFIGTAFLNGTNAVKIEAVRITE